MILRYQWVYRQFLVGYLVLYTLIIFGSFHSFGIFVKPLAQALGIGRAEVSAAISISWVLHGLSAAVSGTLSDRFGPRPVLIIGTFLIGSGYLLMSTCSTVLEMFLFFGVMLGFGMGPSFAVTSATTARWFPDKRGLMLGIVMSGPGLGRIVIAPLSQYFIQHFQIWTAYMILGGTVLCLALPLAALIRQAPDEDSGWATSEKNIRPGQRGINVWEAMKGASFWLLLFIWLLVPLTIQLWQVHFYPHVSDQGIPETAASLLFIFFGIGLMAGRIGWGAIADRLGSIRAFAGVLILISLVQFSTIAVSKLWTVYLLATLFGLSMGGNNPVFVKLVTDIFGTHSVGAIIGVMSFAFAISSSMGPLIAGFIVDLTHSYFWAFFLAGMIVVGSLILLNLLRIDLNKKPI
jgi:OFA family oxalate/formate antiporter-like MFS transporter